MTHRPIKILPDGTHQYASYHRYKPLAPHERKNKVRKPDDPRAVRYGNDWFLPLDVLPDHMRTMPQTRPDDQTLDHWAGCQCEVCQRPTAPILWERRHQRKVHGLDITRESSLLHPEKSHRAPRPPRGAGRSARSSPDPSP